MNRFDVLAERQRQCESTGRVHMSDFVFFLDTDPRFVRNVAKRLDVPVGQLRKQVFFDGFIPSDVFFNKEKGV